MNCSLKLGSVIALVATFLCSAGDAAAQDSRLLRFYSTSIRDRVPTAAEARAFAEAKDKAAKLDELVESWTGSPEHRERVFRYFNDMFGVDIHLYLSSQEFDLLKTTDGVYHLDLSIKPECGEVVSSEAWWSDEPVRICSTAVSDKIAYDDGVVCTHKDAKGIYHPSCGCGPLQLICFPLDLKGKVTASAVREFGERGVYAYEQSWSWAELLGSSTFVGDRWLYHTYLYQQKMLLGVQLPSVEELDILRGLPLDRKTDFSLPPSNAERAGVVTMPGFMARFNNFRSRIRALTEQLLCQDVDGSLNTDGITEFVNRDLSSFDLSHGQKEGCASCHYAMDNMGSTLLGWDSSGFWTTAGSRDFSQAGHIFGERGSGPGFLMRSYVERADGFDVCMARKAWEGFTGSRWEGLAETEQNEFVKASKAGPRSLIREVLASATMRNLRMPQQGRPSGEVGLNFSRDIVPILNASCSGTSCHSAGTVIGPRYEYIDHEDLFRASSAARIANGSMPPATSGKTLSDDDRAKLMKFLGEN